MTARATCLALFLSTAMLGGCATTGAAPIALARPPELGYNRRFIRMAGA